MERKKNTIKFVSRAAIIAAMYFVLTMPFASVSFYALQFRPSEALTILPFIFPEAIPGLFIGCFAANLFSPLVLPLDLTLGAGATLIAAIMTSYIGSRKKPKKWLAPLPPVLLNAFAVGFTITYAECGGNIQIKVFALNALLICLSQLVTCYGLGIPLLTALKKINKKI